METNVAVLVDAKNEYTKQLVQIVSPHLLSGLLTIYDEAYGVCASNKEEDLTMLTFQELLGEVPAWNNVMVAEEAERITDESKCDYLEDVITAVFVCHTKILTTVRVTNKDRKINLKIPSVENFLHQVYIEMAREFWKHPYLLNPSEVSKLDYQHNLQVAEDKICACVEATIRKLLPVKDILKEYLAEEDDDAVDGAAASENPDEMASSPSRSSKAEATTTKADADVTVDNLKETLTDKLKDKIKNDLDTFKKDDAIVVDTAKAAGGGAQTGGGASVSSAFNSMLDAIAGKSDGGSGGTDIKSIAVGGGGSSSTPATPTPSATPTVTPLSLASLTPPASPVVGASSPTTTGSTELSLDSLTSGGSSSTTTGTPLSSMMTAGSTTTGSSELSLDSLGSIEEVKVDYGQPSSSSSSSSTPSVQSSVLSEFDKMAASKTVGGAAPAPAPAPTTSYSFF
jgi:hypothetical protein